MSSSYEQVYFSTLGAMVSAQVTELARQGRGAPDESDMDRFFDEASAVAAMTVDAARRAVESIGSEVDD